MTRTVPRMPPSKVDRVKIALLSAKPAMAPKCTSHHSSRDDRPVIHRSLASIGVAIEQLLRQRGRLAQLGEDLSVGVEDHLVEDEGRGRRQDKADRVAGELQGT